MKVDLPKDQRVFVGWFDIKIINVKTPLIVNKNLQYRAKTSLLSTKTSKNPSPGTFTPDRSWIGPSQFEKSSRGRPSSASWQKKNLRGFVWVFFWMTNGFQTPMQLLF